MWQVKGIPVSGNWLDLSIDSRLYSYDGPRTFTCLDDTRNLYLVHWCDEDDDVVRYLVVAFSELLLEKLKIGRINIHDALSRPRAWIFDVDHYDNIVKCWQININDLPRGILP